MRGERCSIVIRLWYENENNLYIFHWNFKQLLFNNFLADIRALQSVSDKIMLSKLNKQIKYFDLISYIAGSFTP